MEETRFSRLERLVGASGLRRLAGAHVAVVGLGAVGSYAVEGLARAGVGRLRLVDFDEVRPTNINRQLYALDSTVGLPKVEVARRRVADINPRCAVEPLQIFVHVENLDQVLAGPPDLLIDAIDALTPKVETIAAALDRKVPLISCMGAAVRTDPSRIKVGSLFSSRGCPLARRIRQRLRKRGLPLDFTCVYSDEPLSDEARTDEHPCEEHPSGDAPEEETIRRGRKRRTLGSLPTLTGIFGLTAANQAIRVLLGTASH
jgi:tRNA A37 threonylcarbamoyladenosine dehydratase